MFLWILWTQQPWPMLTRVMVLNPRTCMCTLAAQCEPDGTVTWRETEESGKCLPVVGSAVGEHDVWKTVLIYCHLNSTIPERPGVYVYTLPVLCIQLMSVVAGGGFAERPLHFCHLKLARILKVPSGVLWLDMGWDEGTAGGEGHRAEREREGKRRKQAFSDLSQRGNQYAGWEAF